MVIKLPTAQGPLLQPRLLLGCGGPHRRKPEINEARGAYDQDQQNDWAKLNSTLSDFCRRGWQPDRVCSLLTAHRFTKKENPH
jgi:hypothetical protein